MRAGRPFRSLVLAAVAGTLVASPALADTPDPSLTVGSAAARGAGAAANVALADRVEKAGTAVGGIAVGVVPAGKPADPTSTALGKVPTWTWHGWVSGAAGPETLDGTFDAFRGEPVKLVGVWDDRDAYAQTSMSSGAEYASFDGEMDVAVGGLVKGDTWQKAAAGAYVTRWTTAVRNLKAMRGGKGTTYIRIAHEMNGDWMVWGVNSKNVAAYKKAYRLYASIVRKEFPQARLTWSPNGGHHSDVSIDDMYPGDDVVDVVGPDIYDFGTGVTTDASWVEESNFWLTPHSPSGLNAWRTWAARRGKPIAMPEWGLAAGDDPVWITKVHDYMAKYAAPKGSRNVAGRFVYDCYFNAETSFKVLGGPNPQAGAAYAGLVWGN